MYHCSGSTAIVLGLIWSLILQVIWARDLRSSTVKHLWMQAVPDAFMPFSRQSAGFSITKASGREETLWGFGAGSKKLKMKIKEIWMQVKCLQDLQATYNSGRNLFKSPIRLRRCKLWMAAENRCTSWFSFFNIQKSFTKNQLSAGTWSPDLVYRFLDLLESVKKWVKLSRRFINLHEACK